VRSTAIPKDLATRIATHETDAYVAWVAAKKSSDFSLFAPALQKWVDLSLEKAKAIDPDKPAYDVLLDTFEKGSSSARLEAVFQDVKAAVVPLLAKIKAKGPSFIADDCIKGSYDISTQSEMCKSVALDIGFSLETGRLDVSVHPFTGGAHPTDVRMTTRFKQEDLLEGLTGAVHETGHALYEQGRNKDQDGLPASVALSMGIHESQSLLWERMVFLGRPAQAYMLHKLVSFFPETFGGKGLSVQDLYKAMNVVKDVSLIRVEADEVNYPLHVIIRYEIETGLLNGTVKVEDVPRLWNEKMQAYLGVVPPNDAQGCLQDIHWSMGALGYFPTYLLGAACAAQIFECAHESIPDLDKLLADGDFSPLKLWLNEKVREKLNSSDKTAD
jgi:carboxypeptidase Taq